MLGVVYIPRKSDPDLQLIHNKFTFQSDPPKQMATIQYC